MGDKEARKRTPSDAEKKDFCINLSNSLAVNDAEIIGLVVQIWLHMLIKLIKQL